jgi:ferritin-like metal-binding protein YciE
MKTMDALILHHVKDIYYAEKQIIKALPKMAKATSSPELKKAFEHHLDETEGQVERLEQIFKILGKPVQGVRCDAIEGLISEAKEVMDEAEDV